MTMTMDELMKVLDMQEDILQFTHFTNADAWELGTMILMEARRRGAQVGIMIRRSNGEVVFQYCDNGITPHNVELMRRKSNSVLLTERSSLQLYMAATNAPESVKHAGRRFSDLRGRSRRCGDRSSVRHGTGFGS